MRKIVWIADYKQEERPGGAQITNRTMVEYGRSRGLDIKELSNEEMVKKPVHKRIYPQHYFVLNNFIHIYKTHPRWFVRFIKQAEYSRFIHDYDWVYPELSGELIEDVFRNAKSVIYLSPLHKRENEKKHFNNPNSVIVPSPVDINHFQPRNVKRQPNTAIYAGEIGTHKGLHHVYNWALFNPEKFVDVYGWVAHPALVKRLPPNVRIVGELKNVDMADIYSKYEYIIHLPNWFEPFGRSVAEAYLCGCEPIVNNKVGFMSFDWNYSNQDQVRKEIGKSPDLFWDHIIKQL